MLSPRTAVVVLVAVASLAGCNDDGRTLPPAPEVPDVVATLPDDDGTTASDAGADPAPLRLTVEGGIEGVGSLASEFTCDGADIHPRLELAGVPLAAAELALVVRDRSATGPGPGDGDFVHWVVAGLDPRTEVVEAGVLPAGAVTAANDFGTEGWAGPCPPEGDGVHVYEFALHVLAEPIGLRPGLEAQQAAEIVERSSIDVAVASLAYGR